MTNIESIVILSRLLRSWILKPLTSVDEIRGRHRAVEWLLRHQADAELQSFNKSLKMLPNVDKRLTAVLHGRCRPCEFYALCRSWLQFRLSVIQLKSFYEDSPHSPDPLIFGLVDVIVEALADVGSYLDELNESAVKSGDKTQLFSHLGNYPKMIEIADAIQRVEDQLHVRLIAHSSVFMR